MAVSIRQLQRKTLALINNVGENVNHPRFPLSVRGALEGLHRSVDAFVSGDVTVVSDHGALTGLGDDDHTGHPWLGGRPGGQILMGGFATDALDLRSNNLNNSTTARVLINSTPNIIFDLPSGTVDPLALTLGLVSGTMLGTSLTFTLNATGGNSSTIRINNTSGSTTARQLRIDKVSGQTGAMTSWHAESPTFTEMSYISASDGSFNGPISPTFTTSFDPPDDIFHIVGSGDPNKKLRWEVDGLSVATRILTPQDANYIMAGTNIAQTFTKGQTIDNDTASDVLLKMIPHASQSASWLQIRNPADSANLATLGLDTSLGIDAVGVGGFWLFDNDLTANALMTTVRSAATPSRAWITIWDPGAGNVTYCTLDATAPSGASLIFPAAGGTVVTTVATQVLSNKILVGGTSAGVRTTIFAPFYFMDGTDTTKRLRLEPSSITTGTIVTWTASDVTGTVVVRVGNVSLAGQSASIATTDLVSSVVNRTGIWQINAYMRCDDATGAVAGDNVTLTIGWTDDVGATTYLVAGCLLETTTTTSLQNATFNIYATTSTAITYATTLTRSGTQTYSLRLKASYLG